MSAANTLILGGGFGGISTANTLRRLLPDAHQVTVIDESPRFYVGAGKTWMMLGERSYEQVSQSRLALLEPGVNFIEARVQEIDLSNRTVTTTAETPAWDYLVVALGAEYNWARVPGLEEAAHTFYTLEGAARLKPVLEQFSGGELLLLIPATPFKCPPAPYEAAMLLHDYLQKRGLAGATRLSIYTVEGAPMPTAGPAIGAYIKDELAQRGIAYHTQKVTRRVDAPAQTVLFEDGSQASYDLLIAIPPHQAPTVVGAAQLTNPAGWIPVDPYTLEVKALPSAQDVYAVGDVTTLALPGRYKPEVGLALPKAGVFAQAQGRVVASQIAAKILGQPAPETFDGKGYCYLETGGGRAVKAEGSFFDLPHPTMYKQAPDEAQFQDKIEWAESLLRPVG